MAVVTTSVMSRPNPLPPLARARQKPINECGTMYGGDASVTTNPGQPSNLRRAQQRQSDDGRMNEMTMACKVDSQRSSYRR
ncbi:hypothetical protein VTI74DRAFT_533 [Chaetomium olivicolor]